MFVFSIERIISLNPFGKKDEMIFGESFGIGNGGDFTILEEKQICGAFHRLRGFSALPGRLVLSDFSLRVDSFQPFWMDLEKNTKSPFDHHQPHTTLLGVFGYLVWLGILPADGLALASSGETRHPRLAQLLYQLPARPDLWLAP